MTGQGRARSGPRALPAAVRPDDRGAVSAETAVVLPVLAAVALGLVWLLGVGVAQVRVVDAARETARAAARDEPPATALALGRRVAPSGASIDLARDGGLVTVRVTTEVAGPGGLFGFLPAVQVEAQAVAASEQP